MVYFKYLMYIIYLLRELKPFFSKNIKNGLFDYFLFLVNARKKNNENPM